MSKNSPKKMFFSVRNMVLIGMLAAVAGVVMVLDFPMPFLAPPFYKLDFSEAIVALGAFVMGPLAGAIIAFLKVLIFLLIKGTRTAGVGELASFLISCAFVIPAGWIFRRRRRFVDALIGLCTGTVAMVVVAAVLNYYVLIPAYAAALLPLEQIIAMGSKVVPAVNSLWTLVIFTTVPFNLVKAIVISIIVALIYKPVRQLLEPKNGSNRI